MSPNEFLNDTFPFPVQFAFSWFKDTSYNVGLKVSATALVFSHYTKVIEVTVPVQSGTYNTGESYQLSTLNPNQTISVSIIVNPDYQSQEPDLSNSNVTLVWSPTSNPTPTLSVPEFPLWIIPLLLTIMVASAGLLVYHKKHKGSLVNKV